MRTEDCRLQSLVISLQSSNESTFYLITYFCGQNFLKMGRRNKDFPVYEKVEILDAGSEGKAIARVNDRVVFVPFVVPGDVVDIKITKKRSSYMEGRATHFHTYSEKRVEPVCEHFGLCGGCKWQVLSYDQQLINKQKQVKDNLERIGKFDLPELQSILPSENQYFYRNKLEYTFSNRKWLTDFSKDINFEDRNMNGLGFHMPGIFDRIIDIEKCHLQDEPSNAIRLAVKQYAIENNLEFYNVKNWTGLLRNIVIRNTSIGEWMVIVIFQHEEKEAMEGLLNFIADTFPMINSLMYVINPKKNDMFSDLDIFLYSGNPYIMEEMEGLKFKIGPVSFFQTNSQQAYELYKVAREYAGFKGDEIVYDLYTGTGTIANFVAAKVKKVVGIEYIPSAILDARENSWLNEIGNTVFYDGDIAKVLKEEFVELNGKPDVIITDPPRAGMHEKVVKQILKIAPEKIVYVSCNSATQARDVAILSETYKVEKVQPVDMFPQTHHVENVMLLIRK